MTSIANNTTPKRILLVEDEFVIAETIRLKLEENGYSVIGIAHTQEEVLGIVGKQKVDLVISDINLGYNVPDGLTIANLVRKKKDIPFLFLTAYSDNSILARALSLGSYGYVIKPFRDREFIISIEMALYKHEMQKKLRKSNNKLRKLNKELDQTVQKKTSDIVKTNTTLKEQKKFISSIINTIPGILFILDFKKEKLTYVSDKVEQMLGYTKKELVLLNFMRLVARTRLKFNLSKEQLMEELSRKKLSTAIKLRDNKNKNKWLFISLEAFKYNDEGLVEEVIGVATDITAEKVKEIELETMRRLNLIMEKRQQKIKTMSILQGQEDERRRIAMDIHDGIGQLLTASKISLENFKDNLNEYKPEQFKNTIEDIQSMLDQTIGEARKITFELSPPGLYDFGLASSIKKLISIFNTPDKALAITFSEEIDAIRLTSEAEVNLYRIIQESINNAIKHANASNMFINMAVSEGLFTLQLKDDGKGFDYNKYYSQSRSMMTLKGKGLVNIPERVKLLGGKVMINSNIGEGCSITIKIPLKKIIYDKSAFS